MDNAVTNYSFDPKWPFRLYLGKPQRWDRRNWQWIPLEDHKQDVWFDGEKRVVMLRRKVLWLLYYGAIPEGMTVVFQNNLPENHLGNLCLMEIGQNISRGLAWKGRRRVKIMTHRLDLLKMLPSSANFKFFADRWKCNKGSLLNLRHAWKAKVLPLTLMEQA